MRMYLLAGAIAAILAALGALWWQSGMIATLRADNAALAASVAALEVQRELDADARAVADARAKWFEQKSREYDDLREGILRDGKDADLPDWLADVLGGLRGDTNR